MSYTKVSIAVLACLLVFSFVLEILVPINIQLAFPVNMLILFFIIILMLVLKLFFKHSFLFKWLSSVENSMAIIIVFILLLVILGIIPNYSYYGISSVNKFLNSFPFIFTYLYLLLTLGTVVLRKITNPFNMRSVAFVLNHLGLWIVIAAGGFGSYDYEKVYMKAKMNETVNYGYTENKQLKTLPFTLELKDFNLETFLPKLQIVKKDDKASVVIKQWNLDTTKILRYDKYEIQILKYLPYTWWLNDTVKVSKSHGYVGSALVSIKNKDSQTIAWISYPNAYQKGKYIQLDDLYLLLAEPLPKKIVSKVSVSNINGEKIIDDILVNKPLKINGWIVYQKDYNKELGEYSEYSVFELVKDPWLWLVYVGFFMLMLGSVLIIIRRSYYVYN